MKFTRCTIKNFRCFDSISLDFDDRLTVLVAENGGGKTSVLDALRGIISAIETLILTGATAFLSNTISSIISKDDLRSGISGASISVAVSNAESDNEDDTHLFLKTELNYTINNVSIDNNCRKHLTENIKQLFASNDNYPRTLVLCYGARRVLAGNKSSPRRDLSPAQQAYSGCSNGRIDFESSLAWFNDHDMKESRTIKHTGNLSHRDSELEAVRQAMTTCLDGYENPRMSAEAASRFVISKVGEPDSAYSIEQLSDGYRAMLALVMDVARRMALANSEFCARMGCSVLDSPAIILIDEIELHLHPRWQQTVLPTLMKVFPKTQFIVTTHSPQVLTSVARKHIRVLERVDGQWTAEQPETSPLAREAGDALAHIMGVDAFPPLYRDEIHRYETLVRAGAEDGSEAQELRVFFEDKGLEIPDSDLAMWRFLAEQGEAEHD